MIIIPDVSHYEKITIDPALLNSPALINKVTQGSTFVDPTWLNRSRDIIHNNKLIGGYLFATGDNPTDQVNLFLTNVMGALGSVTFTQLKLAVDYEANPNNQCSMNNAEQIVGTIMVTTGKRPLLYTDFSMWEGIANSSILRSCDLWLAEYNPVAKAPYKLWQYTPSASIVGINIPCDANRWDGDLPSLQAWWKT